MKITSSEGSESQFGSISFAVVKTLVVITTAFCFFMAYLEFAAARRQTEVDLNRIEGGPKAIKVGRMD
jgi:hypothetical protein